MEDISTLVQRMLAHPILATYFDEAWFHERAWDWYVPSWHPAFFTAMPEVQSFFERFEQVISRVQTVPHVDERLQQLRDARKPSGFAASRDELFYADRLFPAYTIEFVEGVGPDIEVVLPSGPQSYVEFTARHPTESLGRLTAWVRHELNDINRGWRVSVTHSIANPVISEQLRLTLVSCARDYIRAHPSPVDGLDEGFVDICEHLEPGLAVHLEPWPYPDVVPAEFSGFAQRPDEAFPRLLGPVRRKIERGQLEGDQPTVAVINLASGEVGEQLIAAQPVWDVYAPLVQAVHLYREVDVIVLVWVDWSARSWHQPLVFPNGESTWPAEPEAQALIDALTAPLP